MTTQVWHYRAFRHTKTKLTCPCCAIACAAFLLLAPVLRKNRNFPPKRHSCVTLPLVLDGTAVTVDVSMTHPSTPSCMGIVSKPVDVEILSRKKRQQKKSESRLAKCTIASCKILTHDSQKQKNWQSQSSIWKNLKILPYTVYIEFNSVV